jgi:hypothetical protein
MQAINMAESIKEKVENDRKQHQKDEINRLIEQRNKRLHIADQASGADPGILSASSPHVRESSGVPSHESRSGSSGSSSGYSYRSASQES